MLANTLNIKPTINIVDGEMVPGERLSGKNYVDKFLELVVDKPLSVDTKRVFVTHCLEGEAGEAKRRLERDFGFNNVIMTDTSPAVSMHGGPGMVGIMYLYK